MKESEYQVRHNTTEYSDYLQARFNPSARMSTLKAFDWKGHRWSYRYTDFDDEGDFDVIYRKAPASKLVPPATTEYIKKNLTMYKPVEYIEVPASVISAADIVSSYFETLGIKTWELGNCKNRF